MLRERTQGRSADAGYEVCGMMRRNRISTDRSAHERSAHERSAYGPHGVRAVAASVLTALLAAVLAVPGGVVQAESVKNPIAVFAALDKVTGRISHLEVPIDQTVEFGALKVTPRVCDSRPPTEQPHTASFVEVDEVKLTGEQQRIFTGWMFAESPGLHAVEHPVFDVWLTSCKTPSAPKPPESAENTPAEAAPAEAAPAAEPAPAPAAAAPRPRPAPPPAAAAEPTLPWLTPNASSRRR